VGPAGTRRSGVVVGAWVAYTILVGFFALGFLDPTPSEPGLWGYPYRNMATVVAIATALILPPALLYFLFARLGRRSAMLALVPLATLVLVAYFLVSTRYYVKQTRLFDPFFQVSGHPVPEVQDPGELRVLALGGSTTEGGALKEEERYPVRLSDELGTRLEQDVAIHNAGKRWWTSKHSLMNYVTDGRRWNADVVVVMHAINDLYRSCSPEALAIGEYNPRWTHFYGPAINAARPPTFAGSVLSPVLRQIDREWYKAQRYREVDFPIEHYQSLPDFERHLRALVGDIRKDGSQPVLMTQPTLLRAGLNQEERNKLAFGAVFCSERISPWNIEVPSSESLGRAMAAFNDVTREVAREEGVPLVDLSAVVPQTLDYFVDDVHHTPEATALISREVADVLVPLLVERGARLKDEVAPNP